MRREVCANALEARSLWDLAESEHIPPKEPQDLTDASPDKLKHHPDHDWARVEGEEATLGITWYAQDSLGEIVAVNERLSDSPEQISRGSLRRGVVGPIRLPILRSSPR